MDERHDGALELLRKIIRDFGSVLVAYSGGVDSALVMAVAQEQLGSKALACIGISPSYPARERRDAITLAESLGAAVRLIEPQEHADPAYAANSDDRCFFCKAALFSRLALVAAAEGWKVIADGTHLDDVGDHVHGMRAAARHGVRSPLLEAQLTKQNVRDLAQRMGLAVWDKPAMACLASRIPHGTPVTPALLQQIETAEEVLAASGVRQFRVRHHGELARIELPPEELWKVIERRQSIIAEICAAGYKYVTVDLAGFRGGAQIEKLPSAAPTTLLVNGHPAASVAAKPPAAPANKCA